MIRRLLLLAAVGFLLRCPSSTANPSLGLTFDRNRALFGETVTVGVTVRVDAEVKGRSLEIRIPTKLQFVSAVLHTIVCQRQNCTNETRRLTGSKSIPIAPQFMFGNRTLSNTRAIGLFDGDRQWPTETLYECALVLENLTGIRYDNQQPLIVAILHYSYNDQQSGSISDGYQLIGRRLKLSLAKIDLRLIPDANGSNTMLNRNQPVFAQATISLHSGIGNSTITLRLPPRLEVVKYRCLQDDQPILPDLVSAENVNELSLTSIGRGVNVTLRNDTSTRIVKLNALLMLKDVPTATHRIDDDSPMNITVSVNYESIKRRKVELITAETIRFRATRTSRSTNRLADPNPEFFRSMDDTTDVGQSPLVARSKTGRNINAESSKYGVQFDTGVSSMGSSAAGTGASIYKDGPNEGTGQNSSSPTNSTAKPTITTTVTVHVHPNEPESNMSTQTNNSAPHTQTNTTETAGCPDGWWRMDLLMMDNVCYYYPDVMLPFAEAEAECAKLGSHIVAMHSMFDVLSIATFWFSSGVPAVELWIGLSRRNAYDFWKWTDGKPVQFLDWYDNSAPLGSLYCATSSIEHNFCWLNRHCMESHYFFCSRSM